MEKKNLQLLHCIKHENIVELLCSYSVSAHDTETHFLIFREEPMDLNRFFRFPKPPGQFSNPETYYFALQDLASALHSIHEFKLDQTKYSANYTRTGSHRDLRPHNILVRANTMLIADFGLADFKDPNEGKGSQTLWKAGRGDYIAPECYEDSFDRRIVGRSLDIWAFGCMIVDIVTYMTGGATTLEQFCESRVGLWREPVRNGFFFHDGALKAEVINQIAALEQNKDDPACSVLMEAVRKMLAILPKDRSSSLDVWISMQHACLVKLSHQASSELVKYDNFLKGEGDSGPSQITLWFEMARLCSWQEIVGTAGPSTWNSFSSVRGFVDVKTAQTLVFAVYTLTKVQRGRLSTTMKLRGQTGQADSLHLVFQEKLTEHVQRLFDLLPTRLQKRADNGWTQRLLDKSAEEDLTTLAIEGHTSSSNLVREIGGRAQVKKRLMAVSTSSSTNIDDSQLSLQLKRLSGYREHGTRQYAFYEESLNSEAVLVEEIHIEASEGEVLDPEEARIRKVNLARLLATPDKPPSFHVLDCIGFIDGRSGQLPKFLHKLPNGYTLPTRAISENQMPQDLLWLLERPQSKEDDTPALERRIVLAQVLVTSLHSLHLNGWLHKTLNSKNILFFPGTSGVFDLAAPRIIGFTQSRPDGGIWSSAGYTGQPGSTGAPLCIHPSYTNQRRKDTKARFRRVYDYYSLGILLLEIGIWKSHKSMLTRFSKIKHGTEDVLFMKFVPRLLPYMGSTYTNAVTKCLQIAFKEDKPGASAEGQLNEFYNDVVEPIMEMGV
jgi:serine/threonine protein kinase